MRSGSKRVAAPQTVLRTRASSPLPTHLQPLFCALAPRPAGSGGFRETVEMQGGEDPGKAQVPWSAGRQGCRAAWGTGERQALAEGGATAAERGAGGLRRAALEGGRVSGPKVECSPALGARSQLGAGEGIVSLRPWRPRGGVWRQARAQPSPSDRWPEGRQMRQVARGVADGISGAPFCLGALGVRSLGRWQPGWACGRKSRTHTRSGGSSFLELV